MKVYRLMWAFGGLFVLFGLLMAAADGDATMNFWGGLSIASLGGFAIAMVLDGISKGEVRIQSSVIRRSNHPRTFWAALCLIATTGIVVLISSVWVLFFK